MTQTVPTLLAETLLLLSAALLPLSSQTRPPQPQMLPLKCAEGDCPLLRGIPQTAGMRSGYVRLKPRASVGWHTTGQNEEALVILHGRGEALIEGQPGRAFEAPMLVYIPPATRHNVTNTGEAPLEYVYVVAAASVQ
ncbi:MAG TPA: cupin domain-containing protein [Terriglobia bacterium]|nr:cupin domain-containing protein [Terriglobia bacterium]